VAGSVEKGARGGGGILGTNMMLQGAMSPYSHACLSLIRVSTIALTPARSDITRRCLIRPSCNTYSMPSPPRRHRPS
jgi:hypothetical protein